ncbi:hypothetical protein CC2G_011217 [Coprinopsis cinerea AmutBmut pab1-1]|nr:hypothetical protein CC2G_011217 [Coprinopsis cinerea AmutBmut pab1-1]
MSKLPPELPIIRVQQFDTAKRAYSLILNLESELTKQEDLVRCRIVGYLLHHAPTDRAIARVVDEIVGCSRREEAYSRILEIGGGYLDCFIRLFRNSRRRTGIPSNHAESRPSLDLRADRTDDVLTEPPRDYSTAKEYIRIF